MSDENTEKRSLITITPADRDESPIELVVTADLIATASTGCTSCGSAGCHTMGCPMENEIPEINKLHQKGAQLELAGDQEKADEYYKASFEESWGTNRWGLLTGRLCPSDQLCEGSCIYVDTNEGSILIRGIEYNTHARAWENDWVPPLEQKENRGKSIGIIGSGFGAIAAAEIAFEQGYDVTIYERSPVAGGLGAVGIPRLKMDFADVERYTNRLKDAGVKIMTNTPVGESENKNSIPFNEIAEQHDGIIVATGKYKSKSALSPENGSEHTVQAIDFLSRQSYNNMRMPHSYDDMTLDAKGKRVVVIGGGDTAMDCLRTAKTIQEAESSTLLYYRDKDRLSAGKKELQAATEEGVDFEFNASTDHIVEKEDGTKELHLENGKIIDADMVIEAVGFDPEDLPKMFGDDQLPTNRWGGLETQKGSQVFIPGTDPFDAGVGVPMAGLVTQYKTAAGKIVPVAGVGDVVGSSLAVHALAGGRDIIEQLHTEIENLPG